MASKERAGNYGSNAVAERQRALILFIAVSAISIGCASNFIVTVYFAANEFMIKYLDALNLATMNHPRLLEYGNRNDIPHASFGLRG